MDISFKRVLSQVKDLIITTGEVANTLVDLVTEITEFIESLSDEQAKEIKLKLKFDEITVDSFSLESAVNWFKENLPEQEGIFQAGILKIENLDKLHLHLFFIKENQPCLNGEQPHFLVKAKKIDKSFLESFGKNPLLIIK